MTAKAQTGSRIGPSGSAVAGAAAGAAVAIVAFVVINHSHHTLTGCAFNGASGMKLKAVDGRTYSIEGDSTGIKTGEKVKLHGSRGKKSKDGGGDQVFNVEKVSRDYGPCHVDATQ